jgi:hypothetical protein
MAMRDIGPAIERGLRALPRDFAFDINPRDFDFDIDVPSPRRPGFGRGRLGVTLAPLTVQLAQYFGVKEGALVSTVETDSAAGRAGLRAGDVIIAVTGRGRRHARGARGAGWRRDGPPRGPRQEGDRRQGDPADPRAPAAAGRAAGVSERTQRNQAGSANDVEKTRFALGLIDFAFSGWV